MKNNETHKSNLLTIDVQEKPSTIEIMFSGKSTEREPGHFITPILLESLQYSSKFNKRVVMNFESLEYMNSSTITPLIRILENAKDKTCSISINYKKSKKWQELCFSALKIFETKDRRIQIKGME
ncbi:MAG: SiaC family regulatory phosphoprotein [Spirochaetota bacterium]